MGDPRGPPPGSQAPEIKLKSYKLSLSRIKKKAAPFAVPQSRISTVADLSEESVDDDDDVNNRSVVLRLTLAQNADGSFPITDDIAKIIGVSLTDMLVFGTNIDPRAWVTLVCIEFLEQVCQNEKDVWELVVMKAHTWVNKNFPNLGQGAKILAKNFALKNVNQSPRPKMCNLGHQLHLVPASKVGSGGWYCDRKSYCSGGHGEAGLYNNVQVWRCLNDWRMTNGGTCDFDLCDDCVRVNN